MFGGCYTAIDHTRYWKVSGHWLVRGMQPLMGVWGEAPRRGTGAVFVVRGQG